MRITGLDRMTGEIDRLRENVKAAAQSALAECAMDLKRRSVEMAPVDLGDLRGSCFVEVHESEAFVGYSSPYAMKQHEELEYNHPKGGEAKYLEKPYNQNLDRYKAHIRDKIKEVTG